MVHVEDEFDDDDDEEEKYTKLENKSHVNEVMEITE